MWHYDFDHFHLVNAFFFLSVYLQCRVNGFFGC